MSREARGTVSSDMEAVVVPGDKGKEEAEMRATPPASDELAALLQRTSLASLGIQTSGKARADGRTGRQAPPGCTVHVVGRTDTLEGVAMRYGTTVEEVKRLNKLWSARDLYSRSTLFVPEYDVARAKEAEREEREAKIVLMRQTVNVDDATAIALLKRHNWMMERAVEFHLAEQARQAAAASVRPALMASDSSCEDDLADPSAFFDQIARPSTAKSTHDLLNDTYENELL